MVIIIHYSRKVYSMTCSLAVTLALGLSGVVARRLSGAHTWATPLSVCACVCVCVQSVHIPHPLECLTHQIYCSVYFQSNGLLCCHCCPGFKMEAISIVWASSCAVCNVHGPFLSSVLFPVCTSPPTPPTGNYCMCLQAKLNLSCPWTPPVLPAVP